MRTLGFRQINRILDDQMTIKTKNIVIGNWNQISPEKHRSNDQNDADTMRIDFHRQFGIEFEQNQKTNQEMRTSKP